MVEPSKRARELLAAECDANGDCGSAADAAAIRNGAGTFIGSKTALRAIDAALAENEACRAVITEANNSLYGSQGFFLSDCGGEPNKYHLSQRIEELKAQANSEYNRAEKLQAALFPPDARDGVLEEAAKVAEQFLYRRPGFEEVRKTPTYRLLPTMLSDEEADAANEPIEKIAKAIRALKQPLTGGGSR